jgi:hypothetical protein
MTIRLYERDKVTEFLPLQRLKYLLGIHAGQRRHQRWPVLHSPGQAVMNPEVDLMDEICHRFTTEARRKWHNGTSAMDR